MTTTLVAGATGYLGRHIVAELNRRGVRVRAIARSRQRAEAPGPWGSPALSELVDEWAVGDVTDHGFVASACDGADAVISALGVTRQNADLWDIDYGANLAMLESAERLGIEQFCFVNVIGAEDCPSQLTQAKAAFARRLSASPVTSQIMNPSAYFSDMGQVLRMAQHGRVFIVDPEVRLNPIHGADLALACVERQLDGQEGSWDVGGPDVLSWRAVAQCAFRALGRPERITVVPPVLLKTAVAAAGVVIPRRADILRFISWGMLHDSVGTPIGSHRLLDFFTEQS